LIHPQAIIDPSAQLHETVSVGPFTIIGPDVTIDEGTVIGPNNIFKGPTRIGKNNRFFHFCTIGEDTPDLKYKGEPTELIIGDNNTFREYASVRRGTVQDAGKTVIGDNNLIMCYAHVGHDCFVGNHCIMSNSSGLAGHVHLSDWVIVSGFSAVHQYCHIGPHAFVAGYSAVFQDVPAFVTVQGAPAVPRVINAEGLKRRGFASEDIKAIQTGFKTLYKKKLSLADATAELKKLAETNEHVKVLYESVAHAKRNIVR